MPVAAAPTKTPPAKPARRQAPAARGDSTHLAMFGGKATLTVEWTSPLTPGEWEKMVKALEAMGYVSAKEPPEGDDE